MTKGIQEGESVGRVQPRLLAPGYTTHDAHGYRNGMGPCLCEPCGLLRALPPAPTTPEEE